MIIEPLVMALEGSIYCLRSINLSDHVALAGPNLTKHRERLCTCSMTQLTSLLINHHARKLVLLVHTAPLPHCITDSLLPQAL